MRVVIIEDELPAANRLQKLLLQTDGDIRVEARLDSVESAVRYFTEKGQPELIFMDIQLADGISFDIFSQVNITAPVIFTTAFDQYSLKAFKVNSIDYLLKPIEEGELQQAVNKYKQLHQTTNDLSGTIQKLMQEMNVVKFRERLLIKRGQQFTYLKTTDVAYCYADGKLCFAYDKDANKHLLETNLTDLETQLDPRLFYRINRSMLVNIDAIKKVHTWLGGRLKIELSHNTTAETIVSRERVNGFKEWMGN